MKAAPAAEGSGAPGESGPPPGLSEKDFRRLSAFIYGHCGIKLPPSKKTMLEARLHRRVRALGLRSFRDYCDHLLGPGGTEEELVHTIDLVTTNKTEFFREPAHFDFLAGVCLPELVSGSGAGLRRRFTAWSAGCSSGEEPYTLAMVLAGFAEEHPGFDYAILGTDISTRVLEKARLGVYEGDRAGSIPPEFRTKHLLRSRDRSRDEIRIAPGLRARVAFRRLNFMDGDFGMREPMDVIFCRNVIIYFDRATQEELVNRLCRHLVPGGYLFLGHSETLFGLDVPVEQAAPTIYRRPR